ncbi:MAG: long-chain fatty acid--CoA ligase [Devosia nanyangense]|uniref:3-methylmercaptopropionyl-CoA ligase n=1 Tax=Devosia nanyangense TaxID=1228055 RepID=A0A933L768_9HYPH|nr:long-chain fatty acid--CoA ligase [Devosia nanyangense]
MELDSDARGAGPEAHPRPWIDNYPPGITWDVKLNLTPVHEQILAACEKTPDAIALDFLGGQTSFGELGRAILALAGALQTQYGVKKGTRVALLLPNTPFYVVAYYAILRAGGTVVNCNPLYTVHELSHITSNAGADLVVTLDLKLIFEKAEALVKAGRVKKIIVCHFPAALPMLKRVLFSVVKRKDLVNVRTSPVAGVITRYADLIARGDTPGPVAIDAAVDVAVQQYTGGTTGLPKGAMLSHANIAANMSQIDAWGCGIFYPPSKVVAVLPFFHIFAMTVCMNVPLGNGTQVVMVPRFELKGFLEMLKRTRPNVLPAVPTLIQALSKVQGADVQLLDCLDVVVSGGAALPGEARGQFAKVSRAILAEGYGLTEASPVVCCAALRVPSKPLSVGQPLPATDVRFIDIETMKPAKAGERGEVQVRGPQVMLGYYDDPNGSKDAFMDGWLRTGDVGYIDPEGYVFLVDRIKDLIISSGFNVYPRTIEEALIAHPAVDEANVIGVPDEYRGEAGIAFVKLKAGQSVAEHDLKMFIAERLNKLEMPREIIFKDQLPKTLIGKLSKKELRDEYKATKGSK